MNIRPESLSEAECELVLQYRVRQASTTRRLAAHLARVVVFGIAALTVVIWFQSAELQTNLQRDGYLGDIPAPLSWIVALTLDGKN